MRSFPILARPDLPTGLEHPGPAQFQDGVFTRRQARLDGYSDSRQRRMLRAGLWIPLAGRALVNRSQEVGPWQRARAVGLTGLVVSHDTAGQLWSLTTPDELHGIGRARNPAGIVTHELELAPADVVEIAGLRVTSPMRTLVDLMCARPPSASVPFITDALRRGLLTPEDLAAAASVASGRWGVERARVLATTCSGNPHSPLEWQAHGLFRGLGPGWEFNVAVHDDDGLIGVADALHRASQTVVEFDGRAFHGPDRFQLDRTRDQRFAAIGYLVVRFTAHDVQHRPYDLRERVRRIVSMRMGESA